MHGLFPSHGPVPELAAVGVTPRPELAGSGSHRGVLRHRGGVVYAARNRAHPPPRIHQTPHTLRRGRRGLVLVVAQRVEGTLTPREQVTARGHRRRVKGAARNLSTKKHDVIILIAHTKIKNKLTVEPARDFITGD